MAVSPVERRGREEPGTRRQMGKGGRIQAVGGRPVPTRIREHSKIITRAEPAAWSSGIRAINPPTVPRHLFLTILYAPFIQPTTVRQSSSRFTQIKFHEFPERGIRIHARHEFYRHAASHDDFPSRNSSCRRSWSFFKMLTYVHVVVVDNGNLLRRVNAFVAVTNLCIRAWKDGFGRVCSSRDFRGFAQAKPSIFNDRSKVSSCCSE